MSDHENIDRSPNYEPSLRKIPWLYISYLSNEIMANTHVKLSTYGKSQAVYKTVFSKCLYLFYFFHPPPPPPAPPSLQRCLKFIEISCRNGNWQHILIAVFLFFLGKPVLSKHPDVNFNEIVSVVYTQSRNNPVILHCNGVSSRPKPAIAWEFHSSDFLKNTFTCKSKEDDWKK